MTLHSKLVRALCPLLGHPASLDTKRSNDVGCVRLRCACLKHMMDTHGKHCVWEKGKPMECFKAWSDSYWGK